MGQDFNVFPSKEELANKAGNINTEGNDKPLDIDKSVNSNELEATLQMIEETRKQLLNKKKGVKPSRPDLAFDNPKDETPQQHDTNYDDDAMQVLRDKANKAKQQYSTPNQQQATPKIQPKATIVDGLTMAVPPGYNPIHINNIEQPFDMLPIPSEGKIYPHKKGEVKVAFLNAADENMLTSPNLLMNGKFIKLLLERKILDPDFSYEKLHIGDRNAILVWLRATAWGPEYDIIVPYPDSDETFQSVIDLNSLKIKKLEEEPDKYGYLSTILPHSNDVVVYRFLNMKDLEELIAIDEYERNVLELDYTNTLTYRMERHIISINGETDSEILRDKILLMHPKDSRHLRTIIDKLESGIEQNITVKAPGGESVDTYFPVNEELFWVN